ncbi:MAG: response regulator [Chitinispirillales bacterium]|jgi:signal transduction histidine kinase/ActR/RegA family two-component response regulator|nr:response regulator [Chitinispirillales bacterium]
MPADGHLLAHVLEYTPIGILIFQRDSTAVFVNQYVLTLFDCDREDVLDNTFKQLADKVVSKVKREVDVTPIMNGFVTGTLSDHKVELVFDSRPDIVCRFSAFDVEATGPYPDCTVLVVRDITHEHRVAELVEAKNIDMAKMNAELARSLAEQKKVSDLKSNFLSIASHELNTPLTSIKGYSDIIIDNMRDKVDPSVYRMIESIGRAADRLHKVVNNILDVTKIERGRLRLRPEYMDLGTAMRDCVEEMAQIAQKRNIAFLTDVPETLPQFYGDKHRIMQVFTNLMNNAVKYSPDGSTVNVAITVDGESFHITVADNGIGIDKSEHKNIFAPFYEIGSANRHSTDPSKFMGGGSGLGLSIVKGIVERHGGTVWVESQGTNEGTFPGSIFHVSLPLNSEISWDDDESNLSESRLQEADNIDLDALDKEDLERPVILFIDQDKESTALASTVIENVYDILVVESGEQGLITALSQKPSLILIDSRLPGLDGYTMCRILRSLEETKDIPIAIFSAGVQDEEIQKGFSCGADDFVVKPFTGRELVEKVCRLLMKKKQDEVYK